MMEAASEFGAVSATVLSPQNWESPWPIDCIDKPPLQLGRVAVRSQLARRSMLHTRFRIGALRDQLRTTNDDRYAVNHTYMAESVLDATGASASERVCINLDVSESLVFKAIPGHPLLRRIESDRILTDEVRCLTSARSAAGFDEDEIALYATEGVPSPTLLRPSFPPAPRVPISAERNLVFLGDRTWKPNYLALERLMELWGALRQRSPQAQLVVLGQGPIPPNAQQDGVEMLGQVESIDPVWNAARALIAPITIGGGVRVKILDAASRGIPVVASPAGVGSISSYLPVKPFAGEAEMVEECAALLNDRPYAQQRSDELFEANREWSAAGWFTQDVGRWLELSA
jgi:glycosyltransferase involved in cell wall biosynthesis